MRWHRTARTARAVRAVRAVRLGVVAGALAAAGACAGRAAPGTRPTPAAAARSAFPALADSLLAHPQWSNAHWGVLVVDAAAGDTVYSRNAGKLFMPASNQKLVTGATALALLGADYRWRTVLVADRGALADGTLRGDLRVVGRGDPTVSDRAAGDAMLPMRALADSLYARGLRRIVGRVVAAGDAFGAETVGYGWALDDLAEPYGAAFSELLFNEGALRVVVRRAQDQLSHGPSGVLLAASRLPIIDSVVRSERSADAGAPPVAPLTRVAARPVGPAGYALTGDVAPGDSAVLSLAIRDPRAAYVHALTLALHDRGIAVGPPPGATPTPSPARQHSADAGMDTLATRASPPLRDVLTLMEKPSQNQIAEVVFRTIGLERAGAGTPDSARAAVERQLAAWGVAAERDAVVRDGSGLSRHDYVTPAALVRVLDAMWRRPDFRVFFDALPVAGVDGTLRNRMRGTAAAGNVHAKTGTIDRSRALSGYVTTAAGRLLLFSMLCNNYTAPTREVERVQDALLVRLAAP